MGITFTPVLDAQDIGSVVLELNDVGSPTYSFLANPGNLFAIDGNQVSLISAATVGSTSITIGDSDNNSLDITFDVIASTPVWIPGQRPFVVNSVINLPLGTNIPFARLPWAPPTTGGAGLYVANIRFTFDVPDTSAPLVNVNDLNPGAWGNPTFAPNPLRMTSGFQGLQDGGDEIGVVVDSNVATEFHSFTRSSDTTATVSFYGQTNTLTDDGFGHIPPLPNGIQAAGPVATGSALLCGGFLRQEADAFPGGIQHALNCIIFVDYCNLGPGGAGSGYSPAIAGDGNRTIGFIAEGQFLGIPPSVSMPDGLSSYGQLIFKAAQQYGIFVNDTGGGTNINLGTALVGAYAASSWTGAQVTALNVDARVIIPMLRKVGFVLDGFTTILFPWCFCSPQRAALAANGTTNILQVVRDSDSHASNVSYATTDASGLLNVDQIATFCAGTVGRVSTYFTQFFGSGQFDSAGGSAPIIYQSGALVTMGGQPALLFDGSTNYLKNSVALGLAFGHSPYFRFAVQISDYAADYALFGFDVANGLELRIDATTGFLSLLTNSGTSIATCSIMGAFPLNVPMIVELKFNFTSRLYSIFVNGVLVASGTDVSSAATVGNKVLIGSGGPTSSDLFKGLMGDWAITATPQPNPQFVLQQYAIDFWQATTPIILGVATDNFTDTNGTDVAAHAMDVGNGWTDVVGTHFIQSNAAKPNTLVSSQALSTFSSLIALSDFSYQCTLTPISGGFGSPNFFMPGLVFRYTDVNNYFVVQLEPQNSIIRLYRVQGGSAAILINAVTGLTSGVPHVIDVTTSGNTIGFTVDGGSLNSVSSTFNNTATICGIRSTSGGTPASACIYDTMTETTLTPPPPPVVVSGSVLLADGTSHLLQTDGTSKVLL